LIVGAALFVLITYPPKDQTAIKDVLLKLTRALTSIVGFYFGGKGAETKPTEPKATGATGPVAEKPKAEKPKAELYTIKEDIVYQNKQYLKALWIWQTSQPISVMVATG
jgi:hypothetical protein